VLKQRFAYNVRTQRTYLTNHTHIHHLDWTSQDTV